jgi:U3 small nucleolar RNA-associated protein 14
MVWPQPGADGERAQEFQAEKQREIDLAAPKPDAGLLPGWVSRPPAAEARLTYAAAGCMDGHRRPADPAQAADRACRASDCGEWGTGGHIASVAYVFGLQAAAPQSTRADAKLPGVILNEKRDKKVPVQAWGCLERALTRQCAQLAGHLLDVLPYPYTTREEYERALRAPIGKEWNPSGMHQKLITPAVRVPLPLCASCVSCVRTPSPHRCRSSRAT